MLVVANARLEFSFDPETFRWSLRCADNAWPAVLGANFTVHLRRPDGAAFRWEGQAACREVETCTLAPERLPSGPGVRASTLLADGALALEVEFVLPPDAAHLLWRARLTNLSTQIWSWHELDLAVIGSRFGRAGDAARRFTGQTLGSHLTLHPESGKLAFFSNGYQSWSFSGSLRGAMSEPATRIGYFDGPKMRNLLSPVVEGIGHFTSDLFGVVGDLAHDQGLVLGFLSQREHFGHVEAALVDPRGPYMRLAAHGDDVPLGPGESRVTDWAYLGFIQPSAPDPLGAYLETAAREGRARVPALTPVGWCSWYQYFDSVTEKHVLANLQALHAIRDELPLDFVQLDDGFQAQVGDWFATKDTFPRGLTWLSDKIRGDGHTPGLWLAPFIARGDAALVRQRPDWFLKDDNRRWVRAGLAWARWCYALDVTHPGVREHTRRLIETAVQQWGFPYLKLDFMFAGALPGRRYDPTLTRAQAFRRALEEIRAVAGDDVFLLGCGCPLGPAIGIVDGMRISTDVAPYWHPQLFGGVGAEFFRPEMALASARNAIQNTLNRAALHRRWWLNDPDCLLVRDYDTRLTEAEVRSLASVIALSGGMFLVSDDLTRLKPERRRYITTLLPVLNIRPRVHGWLDSTMPEIVTVPLSGPVGEWWLLGVFNWESSAQGRMVDLEALGLPRGSYWVGDLWEREVRRLNPGQLLAFDRIPAHGGHLLAVRPVTQTPQWVASDFHFSQGCEVVTWTPGERDVKLELSLGRKAVGAITLALPSTTAHVVVAGSDVQPHVLGPDLVRIPLTVDQHAEIHVTW